MAYDGKDLGLFCQKCLDLSPHAYRIPIRHSICQKCESDFPRDEMCYYAYACVYLKCTGHSVHIAVCPKCFMGMSMEEERMIRTAYKSAYNCASKSPQKQNDAP